MAVKAMWEYVKGRYLSRYLGEKGQGIVEYALILAFVVVIAVAITKVFSNITQSFDNMKK